MRTKCSKGHLMTKDNVYMYGTQALCMECRRINRRESAKRARQRIKDRKLRDSRHDY